MGTHSAIKSGQGVGTKFLGQTGGGRGGEGERGGGGEGVVEDSKTAVAKLAAAGVGVAAGDSSVVALIDDATTWRL